MHKNYKKLNSSIESLKEKIDKLESKKEQMLTKEKEKVIDVFFKTISENEEFLNSFLNLVDEKEKDSIKASIDFLLQ